MSIPGNSLYQVPDQSATMAQFLRANASDPAVAWRLALRFDDARWTHAEQLHTEATFWPSSPLWMSAVQRATETQAELGLRRRAGRIVQRLGGVRQTSALVCRTLPRR